MEKEKILRDLSEASKATTCPAQICELLTEAVALIQAQAEAIDFARTIQSENVDLKTKLAVAAAQRDAAYADIRLIEQAKNYPLENRPCKVCKLIDCYCSSGGSACKGFKWRGFTSSK